MRKRSIALAALAILIALPLSPRLGLGAEGSPPREGPYVVATLPVIADIVSNVAGGRARVESLIEPGVHVMSYELVPRDSERIARSSLFLYVGYGGEDVLGSYARRINDRGMIVRLLDVVETLPSDGQRGPVNPYFWLDPIRVEQLVTRIAGLLAAIDPDGAEEYRANGERYIEELQRLDEWIRRRIDEIPEGERKIVTVRNTLLYFAERYGLEVTGYVTGQAGAYEPQTHAMVELLERMVAEDTRVVFIEYEEAGGTLRETLETLSDEVGIETLGLLYIESLAPSDGVNTYLDLMRRNTELIVMGLSGSSGGEAKSTTEDGVFENPILRPFKYEFMRRGSATLLLVMIATSLVGAFAVMRGWAIFGDALSHGAISGLLAAYLFGFDFFLGALAAGLVVALAVSSVERRTRLRTDVIIAVTFTSMLALAIAVLSYIGGAALSIEDILFADVTAVSSETMIRTILLSSAVIIFALLLRRALLLYTVDPLGASAMGMRTGAIHYGLLILLAIAIISAFMTIGAIPAVASLIIPPAAALLTSKRPSEFMAKTVLIAVSSGVAGIYASYYIGTNTGAAAILIAALVFAASVIYRSIRGSTRFIRAA